MNTCLRIAKLSGSPDDAAHIEKALEAVPRVTSVKVEPEENRAIVDHNGADQGDLTAALKPLGYIASAE